MLKPDQILAISEDDAKRFKIVFGNGSVNVMQNIKFDNNLIVRDTAVNSFELQMLVFRTRQVGFGVD